MEEILQEFIHVLRASGVRISVSETMDAMNSVVLVGYGHKGLFRDALAATLAKSPVEKAVFDSCFDRFFVSGALGDVKRPNIFSEQAGPPETATPLTQMILSGDRTGISLSMAMAARDVEVSAIRFFTQKGLYAQKILKAMGLEHLDEDIEALKASEDPSALDQAEVLSAERGRLFEGARELVDRQYGLYGKATEQGIMERYLKSASLSHLEQRDFEAMKPVVRKMVKRLKDRHVRRRAAARRGWLDFKRTLRGNLAYQGVIFEPKWKRRRRAKPELAVLCDVSRSVEAASRFMLLFLYSLNEIIDRIRSYLFCSNLVEVSHVFDAYPVEKALEILKGGVGLGVFFGRTDYGQAFRDFRDNGLAHLTKRTTVLILGDARNNYGNPETAILRTIRERSRRVVWLNPEPPTFFGTGDSEMRRYQPYCTMVRQCSTLSHLERAIDFLLTQPV
jgi:uncharacterized protein with von Willebrand factor type A (vWA) domain